MKQRQFLEVLDRHEAERRFREALGALPDLGSELIPLSQALDRVLATDVVAAVDVPAFDRANLDGWAVRAADTYGASEHQPLLLKRSEAQVAIGALPKVALQPSEAMSIPTGGALPRGADAVVLVEATDLADAHVEIRRAVTSGTAVTHAGTDVARGETVLRRGDVLTSRELGVLAAIGVARVAVRRRPRVAILSTGDELVAPGNELGPGQLHDANASLLAAAVAEQGAVPHHAGIVRDDEAALRAALEEALAAHDVVLLSGGTSKGPGDLCVRALSALEPPGIVVHGVALKPGKPLCLAVSGKVPVAVLPGFPTSAIFTFHEFIAPLLREWCGMTDPPEIHVEAVLPYRVRSDPGRTEYTLVHLVEDSQGGPLAFPVGKGSGSVTAWSQADGYFVVPRHVEQIAAGEAVTVHAIAGRRPRFVDLVVIGSHCVGLDLLLGALREHGLSSKLVAVGSEVGLAAAKLGACDVAGIHLLDPTTKIYNHPFLTDDLELVSGYGRLQGVVFRRGDARFEGKTAATAVQEAARSEGISMINRNRGSGTRALIDELLGDLRPPGHSIEASSHHAVAAAVQQGRADFGVAIDIVALDRGLGFLALTEERFDFAIPRSRRQRPAVEAFVALLSDRQTRERLIARGFRT